MTPSAPTASAAEIQARVEAAAWRAALSDARVETNEDFEAWLANSPLNREAWAQVQATWRYFDGQATAPEMMAARREALARASRHHRNRFRLASGRNRLIAATLAAAVVMLAVGGGWWAMKPALYRTELGERRNVLLADGSRVALDSGSLLRVRLLKSARRLELVRGQARFEVAHDATRPFTVRAGGETVTATGTIFNVDLLGSRVLVTLIEGRVVVARDKRADQSLEGRQRPPASTRLSPGQQLVVMAASATQDAPQSFQVAAVSVDKTTAWEEGLLIFENEPLSAVTERMSRYSRQPIVTEGAVSQLKISGVFTAGDLPTFVDTMRRAFGIEASGREDGALVLRSSAQPG
jgi:transmembrane sensor